MPSRLVISAVFLLVAVIMVGSAAYRARGLASRPWPPDLVALVVTLAMLGVSFALQAPLARDAENVILTNLGQLLGNGTTLIAAGSAAAMVLFIVEDDVPGGRRRLRPRVTALAVALVAMTVLFLANPTSAENFTSPTAPPGILAYYLVYLAYLGAALVDLLALIRRYARSVEDLYLRAGMQIVAAGCVVGLLYMVGRTADLVIGYLEVTNDLAALDTVYGLVEFIIAAVLPSIAVLLLVVGVTFRRWAPTATAPLRWALRQRSYRRSYRRLEPLWQAAHAVIPEVRFQPRDGAARPRLRLYGRVTEIHDAEFVVGPHIDGVLRAEVETVVAESGLTGDEAAAVVDAVLFAVGLAAVRDHRAALPPADAVRPPRSRLTEIDLALEVLRLERVSAAFVDSPLVARFARSSTAASP